MSEETTDPIIEDVKDSFDLGSILTGRPARFKTVRVYTDEVTGAELGGSEDSGEWGVLGELEQKAQELKFLQDVIKNLTDKGEEVRPDYPERVAELKADIEPLGEKVLALKTKLDATALDIEIQSLPPIIIKDARRTAKLALDIKGNVPADREEDFGDEIAAQVLSRAIVSITNLADGKKTGKIGVDEAKNLFNFLPISEIERLNGVMSEVVYRSQIAQTLSSSADF